VGNGICQQKTVAPNEGYAQTMALGMEIKSPLYARARAKEGGKEEAENDSSIGRVASLWLWKMAGGCRHDPPPMVDTAETEAWEPWVIWDIWRSSGRTGAAAGSHEISLSGRSMSSTMFLSQV